MKNEEESKQVVAESHAETPNFIASSNLGLHPCMELL